MKYQVRPKGLLDPKVSWIDPLSCWPFVVGIREAAAGHPKNPKRWLQSNQQRAWEEGWDLATELLRLEQQAAAADK